MTGLGTLRLAIARAPRARKPSLWMAKCGSSKAASICGLSRPARAGWKRRSSLSPAELETTGKRLNGGWKSTTQVPAQGKPPLAIHRCACRLTVANLAGRPQRFQKGTTTRRGRVDQTGGGRIGLRSSWYQCAKMGLSGRCRNSLLVEIFSCGEILP